MKYEIIKTIGDVEVIQRNNEDGSTSFIPSDLSNSDYQRYLRWLENQDADDTQGGIN